MPLYRYTATRLNGKRVRGELQAAGRQALAEQLRERGLYLTDCSEQAAAARAAKALSAEQLAEFCRELGTMLGAGVPLVRALSIMAKRDIRPAVREVYLQLFHAIKQGSMLSDAMEGMAGAFPELLVSMYRASESSGRMEVTSLRMAEHYEKTYRLGKKVRSAMVYPIILLCVTFVVLLAVFLLILPKFFELFSSLNTPLPPITQFMLSLSVTLQRHWILFVAGVLSAILALRLLAATKPVRLLLDRIKLRLPVAGRLLRVIYTARFARTLSSCYASGVSIVTALRSTRDTVGNTFIASQFSALVADVRNGKSLSASVRGVSGFDTKLSASIQIGEETGRLYDMLESTADAFDYEADTALSRLVAMLEPVMIILMAAVIGTVIVSVILPLTTLYDAIGMSA